MKAKEIALFKELVEAYYQDRFEDKLGQLMHERFENEAEAKQVLGALCGVELSASENDYDFIHQVIDAITQNQVREKIVQKVRQCQGNCASIGDQSKCQSTCPFDAIIKDDLTGEKWIDETLCMKCGRCVKVCEQGNYLETTQFLPLAQVLSQKAQVIAIVAPAIAGQFGETVTLDQLREAFIQIGFVDMVEVALAADLLSIKEAIEFNEQVKDQKDFMITSCCCPMWVAMLRKVYNTLVSHVSPSVSPMIAMGRMLKTINPDVKVVFIGPCVAKKAEAKEKDLIGAIDYVLTFEEVKHIFEVLTIKPESLRGVPSVDYASRGGRLYARTGGVSKAVWEIIDQVFLQKRELFSAVQVDGMKACKQLLQQLEAGEITATFIEGMGCQGGCVGGPKALISAEAGKKAVEQIAYDSAIKIPVHSEVLRGLLEKIGIYDLEALKKHTELFERKF